MRIKTYAYKLRMTQWYVQISHLIRQRNENRNKPVYGLTALNIQVPRGMIWTMIDVILCCTNEHTFERYKSTLMEYFYYRVALVRNKYVLNWYCLVILKCVIHSRFFI